MNLSDIASEEQRLRGDRKNVVAMLDLNTKERAALDERLAQIDARVDELEAAAVAAFQVTRGAIHIEPSAPLVPPSEIAEAASAAGLPPAADAPESSPGTSPTQPDGEAPGDSLHPPGAIIPPVDVPIAAGFLERLRTAPFGAFASRDGA